MDQYANLYRWNFYRPLRDDEPSFIYPPTFNNAPQATGEGPWNGYPTDYGYMKSWEYGQYYGESRDERSSKMVHAYNEAEAHYIVIDGNERRNFPFLNAFQYQFIPNDTLMLIRSQARYTFRPLHNYGTSLEKEFHRVYLIEEEMMRNPIERGGPNFPTLFSRYKIAMQRLSEISIEVQTSFWNDFLDPQIQPTLVDMDWLNALRTNKVSSSKLPYYIYRDLMMLKIISITSCTCEDKRGKPTVDCKHMLFFAKKAAPGEEINNPFPIADIVEFRSDQVRQLIINKLSTAIRSYVNRPNRMTNGEFIVFEGNADYYLDDENDNN